MEYYYATKHLGSRSGSTVLYLPKEWEITPDVDVTFIFWTGGEKIPVTPYKLRVTPKKMNKEGAVGIYIPSAYTSLMPADKHVSVCIITGDEDGNA